MTINSLFPFADNRACSSALRRPGVEAPTVSIQAGAEFICQFFADWPQCSVYEYARKLRSAMSATTWRKWDQFLARLRQLNQGRFGADQQSRPLIVGC